VPFGLLGEPLKDPDYCGKLTGEPEKCARLRVCAAGLEQSLSRDVLQVDGALERGGSDLLGAPGELELLLRDP
jgi:hypothetical protein